MAVSNGKQALKTRRIDYFNLLFSLKPGTAGLF
jgi:hypothetical protein